MGGSGGTHACHHPNAAGVGGSDRVELLWSDNVIQKKWLEVIVEGNDALGGFNTNTGLASSYVFYFGSAPGDSGAGNSATEFKVNSTDEQSARNNPKSLLGTPATITDVNDFNRDGNVNATDQQFVRNNPISFATALKAIVIGAAGPFAPVASAAANSSLGGQPTPAAVLLAEPEAVESRGIVATSSDLAIVAAFANTKAAAVASIYANDSPAETPHTLRIAPFVVAQSAAGVPLEPLSIDVDSMSSLDDELLDALARAIERD